jgi:GNAT superfamily N-acetyltransferase
VSGFVGPELLGDQHVIDAFDCGDEALNDWLSGRARRNQVEGASRTWVVTNEGRVIAFYASSTAVVLRAEATKRAGRNQPDPLPGLLLGRLAVDQKWQGHGLGAALLKHFVLKSIEVAQVTGVRVLLVHAKHPEAAAFYRRYGFEASPIDELTLMLLMKDVLAQ